MQSLLIARSLVVGFDAILPEKNEQEMRRFEDAETMRLSQLFGKEYSHLTSDKMKLVLGTRDQEWQYAYWDDISRIIDRPDLLVQQARIDRRKDALIQRKKDRGY